MKKKAYRSKRPKRNKPIFNGKLPTPVSAEEGLSGEPGSGVGRGLSLPGSPASAYDEDPEREMLFYENKSKKPRTNKDLKDLFVMLADEMDAEGEVALANMADFMLKKIADQDKVDYSLLFKELMVKIVESDILDKRDLLKELVEMFNRKIKLGVQAGNSVGSAKLTAYQACVSRAEQYVR